MIIQIQQQRSEAGTGTLAVFTTQLELNVWTNHEMYQTARNLYKRTMLYKTRSLTTIT